jgi:hypothetical protein
MPIGAINGRHEAGYISTQHTVWCGTCDVWEQRDEPGTKKDFIEAILMRGWKRRKEAKWQCLALPGNSFSCRILNLQ